MADMTYDNYGIAAALSQLAQAQEAQAMRPQKTSTFTRTTSTSTPRALEDMIMRRNTIGANNPNLLNALKGRESFGYNVGAGLANLTPVQGYGDWGVNALRAFGAAMNRPTDAQIAREQAAQELAQKDLETALAYDKAMGETQTQEQAQTMGYTEMPYAGGKGGSGGAGGAGSGDGSGIASYLDLPDIDIDELNRKAGSWETNEYDPSDKNQSWVKNMAYQVSRGPKKDYGVARSQKTPEAIAMEQYQTTALQGAFDVLKYLRPATDTDVLIAENIAGADPISHWTTRDQRLTKTLNQELRKGNLAPINNLRHWQDTVKHLKQTGEWNPQAVSQNNAPQKQSTQGKNTIAVGGVRNGWRFKGGDPNKQENWEKAQ